MMQLQMQQMQQESAEDQQLQQQIRQLDSIARQFLSKEALMRYGTIKTAHPELALQVMVVINQFVQQNRIKQIDDVQLKEILMHLSPKKKEMQIRKV